MISEEVKINEQIKGIYHNSKDYLINEMCNLLNYKNDTIKYESASYIGNLLFSNN